MRRPAASSSSRASEDCQATPVRVQDIVPQDRNLLPSQSQSTAATDPRAGASGAIAHTYGRRRQQLNLIGYQNWWIITTLVNWHRRTGGDLTDWFGQLPAP